ncbi:MAG: sulfatase family protein [Gaiellaceae bacterium]
MNVLVFVSDALRADHVGAYGARFLNTATLDELAAGGLRFDQAISAAPWTAPSMMSMVTGLYPHRHGYYAWNEPNPAIRTVFDAFVEAEREVATFVFDREFLFKGLRNVNVLGETETLDDVVAWLRQPHERPFLCFVHSWATHMPRRIRHGERKEWRSAKLEFLARLQEDTAAGLESCRAEYREGVEYMSETLLAELLAELDASGLREDTAVVFLSDHGESWGERLADKSELGGIYHLHGATLFDEIIEIPLVVSAPGRIEASTVATQVSSVDVVPTLLELAGLAPTDTDGVSLLARASGDAVGEPVFSFTTDRGVLSQAAIRQPPWKLIRHLETGREQAYRLDLDPRELENRADEVPAELRFQLDRQLDDAQQAELSEDEEAAVVSRLTDLGYL